MLNKFLLVCNNIQKLNGGNYNQETILKIIYTLIDWVRNIGIALAGLSLLVGFVYYTVVDVEQKPRVKQRITQTLLGIFGIVLALSFVNIIIDLFA